MQKRIDTITALADFKRQVIDSESLKIVRFYAEWSGPCQIMGPIYEEMFALYKNSATFYNIDIDKAPLLKNKLGITELPTILFYQNGDVIDFIMGLIPRASLIEKLEKSTV